MSDQFDQFDKQAEVLLHELTELHRGWCNYCQGQSYVCENTAGKPYQCVIIKTRPAVAAALREQAEAHRAEVDQIKTVEFPRRIEKVTNDLKEQFKRTGRSGG